MEDQAMIIGERLRALREEKNFTQGEIERRTGMLRAYVSRVEKRTHYPIRRDRCEICLCP